MQQGALTKETRQLKVIDHPKTIMTAELCINLSRGHSRLVNVSLRWPVILEDRLGCSIGTASGVVVTSSTCVCLAYSLAV